MKRTLSPVRSLFPTSAVNTTLGEAPLNSINRSTPMSALPPRSGSHPAAPQPPNPATNPAELSFITPSGFPMPSGFPSNGGRVSSSTPAGTHSRPVTSGGDQHPRTSHTPLTLLNRDAVNQSTASGTARADGRARTSPVRQRATVMFESEDGGQFVVSYDAPQVRRTQPAVERTTFHLDATYTLDGAAADNKTTVQLDATFTKTGSCDVDALNPLDETLAKGGGVATNDLENSTFNQTSASNATANRSDVLEQSSTVGERRLLQPSKNFPRKTAIGLPIPVGGSRQSAADSNANGTDDEKWGGQEEIADEWSEGSVQSERSVASASTVRSRNEARLVEERRSATRLSSARGSLIPAPVKPAEKASNLPRRQSFTAATNSRLSTYEPTRVNNASGGANAFPTKSGAVAAATGADRRGMSREAPTSNLRKRAPSVENLRPKLLSRAPSNDSMCSEVSETPSGRGIPVSRVPASESGRDNAVRRIPQQPAMSEQVDRRRTCIVERKQSAGAVDRKLTVAPRVCAFKEPSRVSATKATLSRTVGCPAVDSNWQKRKEYNPHKAIEEAAAAMGKPPLSGVRSTGRDLKVFETDQRRPATVGVPTLRGYVQNSSSLQSHVTGGATAAAKMKSNVSTSYLQQSTPREKPMRIAPPGGYQSASAQRASGPVSEVKPGRPSVGRAVSNVGNGSKLSVASEKVVPARGGAPLKSCLKTVQAPRTSQDNVEAADDSASFTCETPSPSVSVHDSLDLPVWAKSFWKDKPREEVPDIAHNISPSPNRSVLSPVDSELAGTEENGTRRRPSWGPKQTSEDLAQVQLYNLSKEMKAVNSAILSELQNNMDESEPKQTSPQARDVPLLGSVSRQSAANLRSMTENMSMRRTDE